VDEEKRKKFGESGWRVGTADEFLGLTPVESAEVETRLAREMAPQEEPFRLDALKMVREIRDRIHEEMKGMSPEEQLAYLKRRAAEFEASQADRHTSVSRDDTETG
jgi:hypothetical protein